MYCIDEENYRQLRILVPEERREWLDCVAQSRPGWKIGEADFARLRHLLPESVLELAALIGLDTAWYLINDWGGTVIPIGKNQTKNGEKLHAMLAEIVGEDNARRIEESYADRRALRVPKCQGVLVEIRHAAIRSLFDDLTNNSKMGSHLAVNNIAREFHMSARAIWSILKKADKADFEDCQGKLF